MTGSHIPEEMTWRRCDVLGTAAAESLRGGDVGRCDDDDTDPVLLHGLGQLGAGLERSDEAHVMTEGRPYSGGLGYMLYDAVDAESLLVDRL